MKRFLIAAALVAAVSAPAYAALAPGAAAPDFKLPAALDGKDYSFDLAAALKKGPVVVYFYPKAFTGGFVRPKRMNLPRICRSSKPWAPV